MQVGVGTQRISKRNSTDHASWGEHREFRKEILQTMQVGCNTEADVMSAYYNASWAPTFVRNLSYAYFLC